jgi:hypothetical protein
MSTVAGRPARAGMDRLFFLAMALAIAATVAVGFGVDVARPEIGFATAPLQVHLHGAVFSLWIAFFVLQSGLIVGGSVALHRRLGWAGAGLATLMVVLGLATTLMALQQHRVPPFFPPGVFLVLDITCIATFGGLTAAAIRLRRSPEWHRRLMLCGTIMVMSPALGRILPMAALGPLATWAVFAGMAVYLGSGMMFDRITRGQVHRAYYWGGGAILLSQALIGTLSFSAPVLGLTAALMR